MRKVVFQRKRDDERITSLQIPDISSWPSQSLVDADKVDPDGRITAWSLVKVMPNDSERRAYSRGFLVRIQGTAIWGFLIE
ncbi:hypothetical protein L6164_015555 [Bauhinia variegata]|uniref:Uncharacterized protein n=1 Tax=Bauhinia variegata TaxID=167791 RepID=A0ACB9NLJ2_BAUVA|nr:hypothetical protein L6164_015555 [Bauhinia variegata]